MANPQPVIPSVQVVPPHFPGHVSLYVGDLDPEVTEAILFEKFNAAGAVSSIRVCRDSVTRRSLGYAYVNYHSAADAERALDTLNFTIINGSPCRIMWSRRDPSTRKNTSGNLFVKNLPPKIGNKELYDLFSPFGSILSCKVATEKSDKEFKSKGFGFVHLENEDDAKNAIAKLNDSVIEGAKLYVGKFERRQDRTSGRFTNVYVKNIPQSWTIKDLEKAFSEYGLIASACLPCDTSKPDVHKGFGFVNYESHEAAQKAVELGREISVPAGQVPLFVDRFQKKSERESLLRRRYQNLRRDNLEKSKLKNLYIKNLDDDVDDEQLRGIFQEFGEITSAVVMREPSTNISRGFGFVCFKNEGDAEKAIHVMRTRPSPQGGRPLYVTHAQRKEERKIHLENEFQTSMVQRMQYQQLFYPPFFPHHQQALLYQSMATRRAAGYRFYPQPQFPYYQQQLPQQAQQQQQQPQAQFKRYNNTNNNVVRQLQMSQVRTGQKLTRPSQPRSHQPPVTPAPIVPQSGQLKDLASQLAEASPETQKNILGERLFPIIQSSHPQFAGKITGMLLEMEVSEILKLLESPQEIKAKIQEALEVLGQTKN